MTPENENSFEVFLQEAFAHGAKGPEHTADSAEPEAVPDELRRAILASAKHESSRLLVDRIATAISQSGGSLDELAEEALDEEEQAHGFLIDGGDPRVLSPAGHARLLKAARLDASSWKELLTQAVASFVVFSRPTETDVVWGRTTGLSGDKRADALSAAEGFRDPGRARRVADEFVEEVMDEWINMT